MLGFPSDLVFPAALSQRQMYALLGNRLSVTVVAKLVTHLLREAGVLPEGEGLGLGGGGFGSGGGGGRDAEADEGEDECEGTGAGEGAVHDQEIEESGRTKGLT